MVLISLATTEDSSADVATNASSPFQSLMASVGEDAEKIGKKSSDDEEISDKE